MVTHLLTYLHVKIYHMGMHFFTSFTCWTKLSLSCNSRWEEERYTDGVKWKFLEHKGPVFAPQYEPLPSHVKFYYDGEFKEWVKSEMKIPVADQLLNNR